MSNAILINLLLESRSGHFIPHALAVGQAINRIGTEYVVLSDQPCPKVTLPYRWLKILPEFQCKHAHWRTVPVLEAAREVTKLALIATRQISKLSLGFDRAIIYLDWYQTWPLIAIFFGTVFLKLKYILLGPFGKRPKPELWVQFHDNDRPQVELIILKLLHYFRIPIHISVYTKELEVYYAEIFAGNVARLPLIPNNAIDRVIVQDLEPSLRRGSGDKTVCLLAGQIFPAKGYHLIDSILANRQSDQNSEVKIQLRVPSSLSLHSKDVDILETPSGQLGDDEYVSLYLTSDVVLMPYLTSRYKYSSSGVFVDAVILGCMPFVSTNTTMAAELHRFGLDELVLNWETDFSWRSVVSASRNPEILAKFHDMTLAYRKLHCSAAYQRAVSAIVNQ
jgi:hypothetical protein